MKKKLVFFLFILFVIVSYSYVSSVSKNARAKRATEQYLSEDKRPGYSMGKLIIRTADGREINYTIEIADDYLKRAYGLMHVKTMPEDRGMLFIFDSEQVREFWMKNTHIPLDILYVSSDLTIKHIAKNTVPHSLEMINSIYPAKYVLELNAGATEKHNIKPGDKIEFTKEKSNFTN